MTQPRPVRPFGIVLSALVLGMATLALFLLSLGGLATALGGPHLVVMLAIVPIYLALAAWAAGTLIGLLRMRSWARTSSLVISGCMVLFGLLFAASILAIQSAIDAGSFSLPPIATPEERHRAFLLMARLCFGSAALGVVGLVYFLRRGTRDAFALARAQQLTVQAAGSPAAHFAQPQSLAWPLRQPRPAPGPLTDFTVALPLETPVAPVSETAEHPAQSPFASDAVQQPWPSPEPEGFQSFPGPQQAGSGPALPGETPRSAAIVGPRRPASITIVAMVSLANAFFTLVGVVSPLPGFLFGMIVSGWPLHLYSLVWAAATAIAGLGMLRLQRPAWLLSFALLAISSLQFAMLLLPGPRARYLRYMTDLQPHGGFGSPQGIPAGMLSLTVTLGMLLGLSVLILFAVMLWRGRWAFPTAAPAVIPDEPAAS